MRRLILLAALLGLGWFVATPDIVQAEAAGITITPSLQEIILNPTEATKTFDIRVTNHTKASRSFSVYALDFGSLNDTGGVAFAGGQSDDLIKKYGLADWIELSESNITVQPDETVELQAIVKNAPNLTPGGHYSAIMLASQTAATDTGNTVGLNQTLSSLILAKKMGGERYDLRLNSITHGGNWLQLPETAELTFFNPGNVHVIPRGIVRILTPGGTVVAEGIINEDSGFLLPETSRTVHVPLRRIAPTGFWPGFYRLEATYRYDGLDRVATKSMPLRFFNGPGLVLGLLAVVAIGSGGFFGFRKLRQSLQGRAARKTHAAAKPKRKLVMRM